MLELVEHTVYQIYNDGEFLSESEDYNEAKAELNEYRKDNGLPEYLEKYDQVIMINCAEAEKYKDKVWTVISEPWILSDGETEVIKLHGYCGGFSTKCLKKVEED